MMMGMEELLSGTPSDYYVGTSKNYVQLKVSDGTNYNYQTFNIDVAEVLNDPTPIVENFALTGEGYLDMMLQGSMWVFPSGVERTLDWAIVDEGQVSWYPDEYVITQQINYVLNKYEEFIDLDFNFLGWFENEEEANKVGSEINFISSNLPEGYFGSVKSFPSLEMQQLFNVDYFEIGDVELIEIFMQI